MKTQVSFQNIQPASHASLESTIGELAARRLERQLKRFDPATVELHVQLEKRSHRDLYHAGVRLALPGATLASSEEGPDLMVALRKAFDDIERELQKHKGAD